nr:unnamed protein product [Digitaria exilis]
MAPSTPSEEEPSQWEYSLRKYLLLLATVVASVTYSAGFNPPGGVWQEADAAAGHLAGDPILRATSYPRYLVFFYCNAIAFALSLVVIVLFLLLCILHEHKNVWIRPKLLRAFMVLDLLSLIGAYTAGASQDMLSSMYCLIQVSVTYASGLSTPGGFWDTTEGGHRPGHAILQDQHKARLKAFFFCNTSSFFASSLILVLLLSKKIRLSVASRPIYVCIIVQLLGLVGAYAAGSSRSAGATTWWERRFASHSNDWAVDQIQTKIVPPARGLLLSLATFATAITFQAGLHPPGGLWQNSRDGHLAGDPILLTTNATRYMTFFYFNSVAFMASLTIIVLVLENWLFRSNMVEAAVMLELFGLIGAYAAGSCRDVSTSIDVMAMAAAGMVYVVIHVIFFQPVPDPRNDELEIHKVVYKIRKMLYLLATLATTLTYQTGLNPPSGSWSSSGNHAGEPVLLYNYPRRYKVFFYCNSITFTLSIAIMILLVNPHLYTPAIWSHALSVCMVAGLFAVMGAYAAGSSQHLTTSICVVVVMGLVLVILVPFVLKATCMVRKSIPAVSRRGTDVEQKQVKTKRKYLMLLGVLVASITYQAGLDPPGGMWQYGGDGHVAGTPVMHDSRRKQYLVFFYSNSTSFGASLTFILVLLYQYWFQKDVGGPRLMLTIVELDLLALLVAYATGSTFTDYKPCLYTAIGMISILAYYAIMSLMYRLRRHRQPEGRHEEILQSRSQSR